MISIAADGTLTVHKEGFVTLKAVTPGNDTYATSTFEVSIEVLDASNGLYLYEGDPHFYYQGAKYNPGELPLDIERNLCLTNPDLKVYLTEYLEPAKASIEDNTEATLTAILNYGANYHSKRFLFDGAGGSCEMADTQWTMLLIRHKGLCAPHASYFCYLMYLSNLTSMAVDSGEPKDDSIECPVLLYEHLSDGSYRARFVTVKKGAIPTYADGTLLNMNDVIYKNMETNTYADPSQGEGHAQYNEAAYAVFSGANNLLLKDIAPLWEQDNSSIPSSSNSSNNNDGSKKVYPAKTGDKWFIL